MNLSDRCNFRAGFENPTDSTGCTRVYRPDSQNCKIYRQFTRRNQVATAYMFRLCSDIDKGISMDGFAQPEHTEGTVSATPGTSGASPVRNRMVSRVHTVAFNGIDVLDIDCQVQLSSGMVAFNIVGLPDKAVAESRERVRAALAAMGLALPPRRITVNLAPADVLKEGSHFDLPIAVAVLMAMDVLPNDAFDAHTILGELALDGAITRVAGVLPAAIGANAAGRGIVCPAEQEIGRAHV